MARKHKDAMWDPADNAGNVPTWERVGVSLLVDLRDELKLIRQELEKVNAVLRCSNCLAIPHKLDRIARNTAKPRPRRKTVG